MRGRGLRLRTQAERHDLCTHAGVASRGGSNAQQGVNYLGKQYPCWRGYHLHYHHYPYTQRGKLQMVMKGRSGW